MKTALLSSAQSQDDGADNKKNVECVCGATVSVASVASVAVCEENILDKISRDRSSEGLKYLAGLSILEQKVCFIAQDHLESSFDLERSSGFIAWKKSDLK
jgi:hypothetical protein